MRDKSPLGLHDDPISEFERWFARAAESEIRLPDAVALATVSASGRPSNRMVLYRGIVDQGLTFFTNYTSRKARHLEANPHAALVFHWEALERQVRFEGEVLRLNPEQSDAYFAIRSRPSRIGAWASFQSTPYRERDEILARYAEIEARFEDADVPRPDFWGGYRLVPDRVEFWAGMPHRLHDRVEYRRRDDGWERHRLQP
ncbi:MAG: pyridoxamine 5'-phosphate oxidase [Acidobacteria bacterium]|nr:pyridoxamine 5'-phosphate oxidase [Acidobacteriota bacterium]NIM63459.1 pyridoxamine 5'-phosphate oxidase [Acidobacteriota bacterium]NIO60887.1 pyridoxamine 5'-phosphate oxidase [Acidobacteriota bacterium]NIQ31079.1 pyridoxamine 5'-phosphate oxidase [Acidobacteriota bacterium]NIQ87348.1 pyridoxamine 5'-phosphate oxidase [Acidobacteriota bacterium]